jgi:hypothetical protein
VLKIVKKVIASEAYNLHLENFSRHYEKTVADLPDNPNVWVRDFLLVCLLLTAGGHRGDTLRNMTLAEFESAGN